uniref:Integrase catalytic domain-containing protein n=1 Tax=Tanacetum cinerariifolium TaxID=118510 RepID=A0A6L2KCE1_TANCI|nr:hypothetical protein [Tanacetum cinerariifolium]
MFLGKYFPPSMVTKLRNEITSFCQCPDESLFKAWECYKLSIDRCPNKKMLPVTQIDMFNNGLTLDIDTLAQRSKSSSSITSSFDTEFVALKAEMEEINKNLIRVLQVNQQVKAVTPNYETCSGPHSFFDCPPPLATLKTYMLQEPTKFIKMNIASSLGMGNLPGNIITNPKEDLKGITTRSGTTYPGPTIPTTTSSFSIVERKTEATKDTVYPTNNGSTEDVQPAVVQSESPILTFEPVISLIFKPVASPVSALRPNQRPSIPYPSRLQDQKLPLADLSASINLMPLSMWNKIFLLDLSPMCMTLELTDRSISHPIGVAEDVLVKVDTFYLSVNFVVVDFNADPRVPLILGRSFLKTERALIDVFEAELTLRVGKEAITFNLDQTSRYSANYNDMMANRIDVIDMACEEYSGFLLEEVDAFLDLEDDPTSSEVDQSYVELKDLPPHLEYAFLEGDDKLPVIIAKYLTMEEKTALITFLKSHKRAIAWKLSDIKGIDLEFCTHKILMKEDFKPVVQHQRRGKPKIHDVIKQEVLKLLDTGLIYLISDSPWVSPVHCVPKKGGFTVVENEENELIPTRLVTGWRVCIDYHKLNEATRKDHFPLPFMDQMLERLARNQYYCFLDGYPKFSRSCWLLLKVHKRLLKNSQANDPFSRKRYPFLFSKMCVEAFQTLKRKLTEAPILIAPDWDMPSKLMCDASDFAIGAILGQRQEKHFRPIHYVSKTITEAESNYTTMENEMLAVVYAFEKLQSYLIMNKSIVYTDHSALKYLFAKKDSKARLLHWVLLIQEFTFKGIDTKGAENLAADHLSRLENPHQNVLYPKEINESFSIETLNLASTRGNSSTSCDRGTHFCNDQFAKVMLKFVVTHRLATPYHPQTSGQVEVSNCGLKCILERTVVENRASWSDKLDGALLAFRTAYKTPIGCTPYKLVYGKEKTKRLHDSKIKGRVFNIGVRVLLFNSRLKIFFGKLKSRWSRPFTISHVFPYGTVELSQPDGPNFKVNGHRLKHYFGEGVPKMVVPDLQTFPKDH